MLTSEFLIIFSIFYLFNKILFIPGVAISRIRTEVTSRRLTADGAARLAPRQRLSLQSEKKPSGATAPAANPPHTFPLSSCPFTGTRARGRRALQSTISPVSRVGRRQEIQSRVQVSQHKLLQGNKKWLSLHLTSDEPSQNEKILGERQENCEKETQVNCK